VSSGNHTLIARDSYHGNVMSPGAVFADGAKVGSRPAERCAVCLNLDKTVVNSILTQQT
jgi:hypothetical protein